MPDYLPKRVARIEQLLSELRKHALFYRTYSTLENIEVLGEPYIRQMQRDLPPLVFQTSVLCRPVRLLKDGFYSSMKEECLYTAANFNYLDALEYQFAELAKVDSRVDDDLIPDAPLYIAFDFNRNINWLVVGQIDFELGRMNTVKCFFVKYERKLVELVNDFCDYYENRPNKEVVFYYDSTALGSNYAVNDIDFRRVIEQTLRKRRRSVQSVYIGQPMNHAEKHLLINRGSKDKDTSHPTSTKRIVLISSFRSNRQASTTARKTSVARNSQRQRKTYSKHAPTVQTHGTPYI